ncbi:MAG: hypothetical protein V4462_18120 [Pseudomonadota bacterium]
MIPSWNMAGVLPPIRPGMLGHSPDRSPYSAALADVIEIFSTSPERIEILQGLLRLRAAFHAVGVVSGFQWVDGSFLEHVELLESRPPNDVDVVTYFDLPAKASETDLVTQNPVIFDHDQVKAAYQVDHYPVVLGKSIDEFQVRQISYWYSMWSHRRDGLWKGFIQVSLDPAEDILALQTLAAKLPAGTTP